MNGLARSWAILGLLLAAFALKGSLLVPPAPSSRAEFNVDRAIGRLERILGDERPHPVDSADNDSVRERLIAELRSLGLEPKVRERPDCRGMPGSRTVSCSMTRNVVAVIGGDRPGKALLLNAHYDSTPAGPGAADDGIGVATLLEVASILRNKPPAQPIILLFNEGEEFGLNGAGAFLDGDPLAGQVGSLINIESRGVDGPAFMFETSIPNGSAIAAFAAATRRPYANSLTADFAKLIPNYTDVVVFRDRGWPTLSYAIAGNETRYHSPGDNVAALSRRSVQHMGNEVMAAIRTLPASNSGGERVYADIAGRLFVSLPLLAAAILLGGLAAGSGWIAWREKVRARPLLACAGAIVAAVAVAFALTFLAGLVRAGDYWRAWPLVSYLAIYASALAAMLAVLRWLDRGVDRHRLRIACWLLILIVGGALSLFLPGAMIFFLFAPALALLGLILPKARTSLLWAAALLQLLMFAELMASLELLLIDGPLWAVAPIAALAALPFLVELAGRRIKAPLISLAILAIGLWAAAMTLPRSSAERPLAFTIDYVRDDDSGKSNWAIANKQAPLPQSWSRIDEWKRGVLSYNGRTRWLAEAPLFDIPAARVEKIGETVRGKQRLLRLRLATGGANVVAIRFNEGVPMTSAGLPGTLVAIDADAESGPSTVRCSGRACDGLIVDVELETAKPVEAKLIAVRFALPPEGGRLQALRPVNAHTQYGTDSSIRVSPITL